MQNAPTTHSAASAMRCGAISVSAVRMIAGVDPLQGANQMGDRKNDDEKTRSDPEPFPADLLLEATPERGQQPMHSSSRRGGNQ